MLQVKDHVVSHETFSIVSCQACGFKFTNPRPSESEIGKYYESEDYIYHSNKKKGLFLSIFHLVRQFTIRKKVKLINSLVKEATEKAILDYGCGTGEFLNACKSNGWITSGIETSDQARNFAQTNFGLHVKNLNQFSEFKENSFDVITLWHVLEHVHRLDEALQNLRKVLKKDGRILIAVPNISSSDSMHYEKFWAALDVPRHLYHFSPGEMKKLLESNGLKLEKILPMPFDSFYVSLLSEKFKTGRMNFISGAFQGLKSNLNSMKNRSRSSSITYLVQRSEKAE